MSKTTTPAVEITPATTNEVLKIKKLPNIYIYSRKEKSIMSLTAVDESRAEIIGQNILTHLPELNPSKVANLSNFLSTDLASFEYNKYLKLYKLLDDKFIENQAIIQLASRKCNAFQKLSIKSFNNIEGYKATLTTKYKAKFDAVFADLVCQSYDKYSAIMSMQSTTLTLKSQGAEQYDSFLSNYKKQTTLDYLTK